MNNKVVLLQKLSFSKIKDKNEEKLLVKANQ